MQTSKRYSIKYINIILLIVTLILSSCASEKKTVKSEPEQKISMAVLYFDNNSITNAKEFDPFRKGLTDSLISDLKGLDNIVIVERTKLESVFAELKLSSSGLVDETSVKKIGRLLGVQYILLGSFVSIGQTLRIDARIFNVSTGVISKSAYTYGMSEDFFELIDDLVKKIGGGLSLSIKKSEGDIEKKSAQKKIAQKKIDFQAILLYSEGLDLMDKKDYSGAENKFNMALKIEPDYKDALQKLNEVKMMGAAPPTPLK